MQPHCNFDLKKSKFPTFFHIFSQIFSKTAYILAKFRGIRKKSNQILPFVVEFVNLITFPLHFSAKDMNVLTIEWVEGGVPAQDKAGPPPLPAQDKAGPPESGVGGVRLCPRLGGGGLRL